MVAQRHGFTPKRRRLRFSLRLLLAVLALGALVLGLWTWSFRRHDQSVEAVRRLGGTAIFGPESVPTDPLQPRFLLKVVKAKLGGTDTTSDDNVVRVNLEGTETTGDDLKLLAGLSGLQSLNLSKTKITAGGLAPLGDLASLTTLWLADTGIADDDLAHLRGLGSLASLDLNGTAAGDAGLEHLGSLTALETLSLHGTKVTEAGLERLCGLPVLASLSLDEGRITSAGVGHLGRMPALKSLRVRVPAGIGKRACQLLAPLKNIQATALHGPDARALWATSAAWDDSTAGIFERICSLVALKPQEEAIVLDALCEACPGGVWQGSWYWDRPPPVRKTIPEQDRIQTVDQLIEALTVIDPSEGRRIHNFNRARLFAGTEAARSAVPALLKLLDEPKRKDSDYTVHRRAVFLLVRIAGADREVVAAVARALKSSDPEVRARTVYAFNDRDADSGYGDVGPKINAEQAEALVPLLLGLSKDPNWEVTWKLADAVESIVLAHPKHADAAVPVLLEMAVSPVGGGSAHVALGQIAKACPEQARRVVPKLLAMLEEKDPQAPPLSMPAAEPVLRTLGEVAPWHPEAARAAVPVLLRFVRDEKERRMWPPRDALCRIVRKNPEELKTIIPAILAMLQDRDPAVRTAGASALGAVAGGVQRQKTEPAKAVVPKG